MQDQKFTLMYTHRGSCPLLSHCNQTRSQSPHAWCTLTTDWQEAEYNCLSPAVWRHGRALTCGQVWTTSDQFLNGVLRAYWNLPHKSTGEKPSFLLFGIDGRTPTKAAILPVNSGQAADLSDNRQELVLILSSVWDLAVTLTVFG